MNIIITAIIIISISIIINITVAILAQVTLDTTVGLSVACASNGSREVGPTARARGTVEE